jgi:hypothetical protein
MTAIREAALAMAAKGFLVFPLQPNSKAVYETEVCEAKYRSLAGGINRGSRDPEVINHWFEINEFINYGICAAGMAVLDVDVKHGKNGLEDLLSLGDLPTTFCVVTPTGGAHYYFSGAEVSQRDLTKAINVRSKGGYLVGPSSRINDESYDIWRDVPLAPLPDHLFERMSAPPERAENAAIPVVEYDAPSAIENAVAYLKAEPEVEHGGRNNAGFRLACRMKDFGLSATTIADVLDEHWNARCPEPLPRGIIDDLAENCFKSGRYAPGCASGEAEFGDMPELLKGVYPETPSAMLAPIRPGLGIEDLPARPWLAPGLLLKGNVTMLSAQPGARKSTFTVALAVGCALGSLRHLGFELRSDPMHVVLINNEDDDEEVDRRIAACCLQHGFTNEQYMEAKSRIHVPSDRQPFKAVGRRPSTRMLDETKQMKGLKNYIDLKQIGLLIADPLASLHDGVENDNGEMAKVFGYFTQLLRVNERLPMLVVHHSRKPAEASSDSYAGDPFSSRGASSIHGAVRLMLTLNTCSTKDALTLGMRGPDEHLNYSRLDVAKDSNSKLGKHTKYFRCESVRVGPQDCDDTAPALLLVDHKEQTELLLNELHAILCDARGNFDDKGRMPLELAVDALSERLPIDDETALGYLELHFRAPVSRDGVMFRVEGKGKKATLTTDLTCGVMMD